MFWIRTGFVIIDAQMCVVFHLLFDQWSVNFPDDVSKENPLNLFWKAFTPLLTPLKGQRWFSLGQFSGRYFEGKIPYTLFNKA